MIYRVVIHWPDSNEDTIELDRFYRGNPNRLVTSIERVGVDILIKFNASKSVTLHNMPCEIYEKDG